MTIKPPTLAQLAKAGMAPIPSLPAVVVKNGKVVRVWNGTNFVEAPATTPYTTQLYAVMNSWLTEEEPSPYLGGSALGENPL